jgi:hypothetical protein
MLAPIGICPPIMLKGHAIKLKWLKKTFSDPFLDKVSKKVLRGMLKHTSYICLVTSSS